MCEESTYILCNNCITVIQSFYHLFSALFGSDFSKRDFWRWASGGNICPHTLSGRGGGGNGRGGKGDSGGCLPAMCGYLEESRHNGGAGDHLLME